MFHVRTKSIALAAMIRKLSYLSPRQIRFFGFDLEKKILGITVVGKGVTVTARLPAEELTAGEIVVPWTVTALFYGKPGGMTTITRRSTVDAVVSVAQRKSRTIPTGTEKMATPATSVRVLDESSGVTVGSRNLSKALCVVRPVVTRVGVNQPWMECVRIDMPQPRQLRLRASDGRRYHQYRMSVVSEEVSSSIGTLPGTAVSAVIRLLAGGPRQVGFQRVNDLLLVGYGSRDHGWTLVSPVDDQDGPDVDRGVGNFVLEVTISDGIGLIWMLKNCPNDGIMPHRAILSIAREGLLATLELSIATDLVTWHSGKLVSAVAGRTPIQMMFNVRYLMDALRAAAVDSTWPSLFLRFSRNPDILEVTPKHSGGADDLGPLVWVAPVVANID